MKSFVLLSGGVDSTACVHMLRSQNVAVVGVFVDYGQRAYREEAHAVRRVSAHYGIEVHNVRIQSERQFGPGEIQGRNLLLLSATVCLEAISGASITMGLHAGTPYWDCGREFAEAASHLVDKLSGGASSLFLPFLLWTKRDIYDYVQEQGVPVELTYSCEEGAPKGCGACGSCRDRSLVK